MDFVFIENIPSEEYYTNMKHGGGMGGAVYGLGLIGALVYYLQHAHTFWIGVLGILKAIFWPALLIYQILGFLKM